jgi:serine/threonine protein kinase
MKVCSVCQRCYEDDVLSCSEENHELLAEARAGDCEMIPNYRLDVLHEFSPSGEIYFAMNKILKKPYLIKILAPDLFDEDSKKRFLRETQALAGVIHPNLARVFESGMLADGSLYVVMEFFTAQTLRDCLENVGVPTETTTLAITRQAAEGLEAMHSAGALHRNIRPENIILTSDAENRFLVKLQNFDFGAIRQKIANFVPDLNLSDFRYYSPEQCAAKDAEARSDVYGLGVVLYETLAGHVPFDAPYADAIILKQINETPPEIKIKTFDIRMLLTHTLNDALQKQSRTRLKSANAFARQLRHIEQLATHSSTPPPVMSYPATMVKSAVEFMPPAKVVNTIAVESKPLVEELPLVETQTAFRKVASVLVENSTVIETPVKAEPQTVIEFATVAENEPIIEEIPPAIETEIFVEDLSFAENQEAIEEIPLTEEKEIVVKELTLAKNQAVVEEIPAKIETQTANEEKAPVIETEIVAEELNLAENQPVIDEEPSAIEAAGEENLPVVETQTVFENPAAIENEPIVEEIPPALETQSMDENPVEAQAVFEAPVEISTVDEISPEAQTIVEEEPVAAENQIVFEAPLETQSSIENAVEIATPTTIEDLIPLKTQAVVEDVNPVAAEIQTVVEDSAPVEIQAAIEYPVQTESQTAIENPVELESPAVIENPVEMETQTAMVEAESPEPVFIDYTTTKLPPLERVIEKPSPENIKITEITPIFSLKRQNSDIHKTSEPVLVNWEQPDDVPTITQTLDEKLKDNADAEFSPVSDFIDDEDYIIDAGEIDTPPVAVPVKGYEYRRNYEDENSVFSSYDSGTSWNLPHKRKILTGAAVVGLIGLAIGGTILNRQIQSASDDRQTAVQSSPNVKSPPKSADSDKVAEADKTSIQRTKNLTVNSLSADENDASLPEISDYQPRETETKTRNKKRAPIKDSSEKPDNTEQSKTASNITFDKQGNMKSSADKQSGVKNQTTKPKIEIFSRPRIVKNPKK